MARTSQRSRPRVAESNLIPMESAEMGRLGTNVSPLVVLDDLLRSLSRDVLNVFHGLLRDFADFTSRQDASLDSFFHQNFPRLTEDDTRGNARDNAAQKKALLFHI
jgi:hypothetical protein